MGVESDPFFWQKRGFPDPRKGVQTGFPGNLTPKVTFGVITFDFFVCETHFRCYEKRFSYKKNGFAGYLEHFFFREK